MVQAGVWAGLGACPTRSEMLAQRRHRDVPVVRVAIFVPRVGKWFLPSGVVDRYILLDPYLTGKTCKTRHVGCMREQDRAIEAFRCHCPHCIPSLGSILFPLYRYMWTEKYFSLSAAS